MAELLPVSLKKVQLLSVSIVPGRRQLVISIWLYNSLKLISFYLWQFPN